MTEFKCPNSIEDLDEIIKMVPLCRKDLYEQAKARIEIGAAHSVSEVSRQIGEETGREPESIRKDIRREDQRRGGTMSHLAGTDKFKPDNTQFRTSFTGDNEWYTPVKCLDAVRVVFGTIDLDPATTEFGQKRVQADKFYTPQNDGLTKEWHGKTWLNPPYSQPLIQQFIEKMVQEIKILHVTEAIILTHNYTDTTWFHLMESVSGLICFTRGRIKFEKADGTIAAPTQGQAFFYYGRNVNNFKEVFSKFGFIR